jgi:rhodanese-related sulfurtransferase
MKANRLNFEAVSKHRVRPPGKAQTDSCAQRSRQVVSMCRGLQRRQRASDGIMKPLPSIGCWAVVAWVLVNGLGWPAWAGDAMSEAEKRAKIETMYHDYKKDFPDVQDITPAAAMQLLKSNQAVFVDVREKKEQAVSMLPGAITEQEFLNHLDRYRDKTIIGYCTISYRSGKLAENLKAQGVVMLNLRGGLLAWVHAGGKVYDHNGETRRIDVYGRKWDLGPKGYEAVW